MAESKGRRLAFLATAEPLDSEMESRIARHREERGSRYETFEEPLHLERVLQRTGDFDAVVVDCMTTWVGNLLHYGLEPGRSIERFLGALNGNEVVITNEVGLGIIPADPLSRKYVDELGRLNARLAERAREVYLLVSGLPVRIKGE